MTAAEFDVILEQRIVEMRRVLGLKAGEYASNNDHLHNFKGAAETFPINARDNQGQALMGMARKHWMSLMDMVKNNANGVRYPDDIINEKIGDAVNYLVLLEAILKERT